MQVEKQIRGWLDDQLTGQDLFLTELKMPLGKVLVTLDGDQGIAVKRCVEISRLLSNFIEEHELIAGAYVLEVGSPGADAPLFLPRQYPKHIGRKLAIRLEDGSKYEGKLIEATPDAISVEVVHKAKGKKATVELNSFPFALIAEARVIIDFKSKD